MTSDIPPQDRAKQRAAEHSVSFIEDGMRVGLGTGSTAALMVRALAGRIRAEGLTVTAVPTSTRTADLARELGIDVVTLDEAGWLDLTIDGADEFDGALNLIKGGGGALLQEKIVAAASNRMIVIADRSKAVETLGAFPLPVEVIGFGWQASKRLIGELLEGMDVDGCDITLRMAGDAPFETDEGNYILDLHLGRIGRPERLALSLNQIPGVVENGLFMDICDVVIVGNADGHVETRERTPGAQRRKGPKPETPDNLFSGNEGRHEL